MKQWRWLLEVWAVRHGLWLLPAMALLLGAIAAWLVWLPAEQARLAHSRLALADQLALKRAPVQGSARPQTLPTPGEASASVQRLFALAQQYGLTIAQADYRRQDSGTAGRWQVQVPASGSYPQVRYFVRAAQGIPGLSLDELNLQRGSGGAAVEARMLFSIWYDSEGARP